MRELYEIIRRLSIKQKPLIIIKRHPEKLWGLDRAGAESLKRGLAKTHKTGLDLRSTPFFIGLKVSLLPIL